MQTGRDESSAIGNKPNTNKQLGFTQGVGAKSATVAHVAMQVPKPALHAMMAGGAATTVTPKVKPAAV